MSKLVFFFLVFFCCLLTEPTCFMTFQVGNVDTKAHVSASFSSGDALFSFGPLTTFV